MLEREWLFKSAKSRKKTKHKTTANSYLSKKSHFDGILGERVMTTLASYPTN